uniref:AstE/AspA barrel-sandwich hybrid domain-containing protein n=2 Tax=Chaetoceros debilis TaxID=122233 RepID=A0A7S3Q3C7_9STRA
MFEYLHLYNSNQSKLDYMLKEMYSVTDSDATNDRSQGVPCYRSAAAIRNGEMSGKIVWPSVTDNPNFPAYMIHKHLQDRDFDVVKTGDALFVDLDGNIIPYDGAFGESIYLMFVNEGGYYYQSSGRGVSVAVKAKYDLETGMLYSPEAQRGEKEEKDSLCAS